MPQLAEFIPDKITVHTTDTGNGLHVSMEAITKDHIARGFGGIGYHVVIQPDGTVEWGRSLNQKGAHVAFANQNNIGIALAGSDAFSYAQFNSLRNVIDQIRISFNIKPWEIYCHYEWPSAKAQGKTCPNISYRHLLGWYCGHNDDAIKGYLLENDKRYKII